MKPGIVLALLGLCLIVLCAGAPQNSQGKGVTSTTRRSVSNRKNASVTTKKPNGKGKKGTRGSNKKPAQVTSTTAAPAPAAIKRATTAAPLAIGTSDKPQTRPLLGNRNDTSFSGKPAVSPPQRQNATRLTQSGSLIKPGNVSRSHNKNQTRVRREIMETMVMNSTENSSRIVYGLCDQLGEVFSTLGIKMEQNDSGFSKALASVCQSFDRLMSIVSTSMFRRYYMPGRFARPAQVNMSTHWNSTDMTG